MNLYLIRHGQTDWNIAGKIQGRTDIPLNETGLAQAELLAVGMKKRPVKEIYCSNLQRAIQTAQAVGKLQKNAEIWSVAGLEEVCFGKWEGLSWKEIEKRWPEELEQWSLNPVETSPPGGENQTQVMTRVAGALARILDKKNHDIAIVSHGATIAYILAWLFQDHPLEEEVIVDNASITTVHYSRLTGVYTMVTMNDTRHLDGI